MRSEQRIRQAGLLIFSCLVSAIRVEAGYAGEYVGFNYNIHFFNYGFYGLDVGENSKEISATSFDFAISPSNTFTSAGSEWMLHRHIMNQLTTESENRCINGYWAGVDLRTDSGGGTVDPEPNMVLVFSPHGEGMTVPHYSSADANIAIPWPVALWWGYLSSYNIGG